MTSSFYTYFHTRNDTGKVFYVGKGKGRRAHEPGRNPHWKNIVAKHGYTVHFAMTRLSEAEAFEHEKFLILCFKDMGIYLTNMTDGGEGVSGYKHTEQEIEENRARALAQMQSKELREHYKRLALERCADPAYTANLSKVQKEKWEDEAHREKMVAAALKRWSDPAERAAQSARTKVYAHTPGFSEKMRQVNTGRKLTESAKAKMIAAQKAKVVSEETRANMRAAWVKRKALKALTLERTEDGN